MLDKTLTQLKVEEAAAIQAQIAGIMQALSPEAYAGSVIGSVCRRRRDRIRKRLLLGTIVEKVVPHKEGADVFFAPGVFQEAEGKEKSVSEESLHIFHTTCIGMSTHK